MIYTITIDYMSENANPITLNLDSKGYRRKIGFYEMRESETIEEFVSRKLTTFLETIKDYPKSNKTIRI